MENTTNKMIVDQRPRPTTDASSACAACLGAGPPASARLGMARSAVLCYSPALLVSVPLLLAASLGDVAMQNPLASVAKSAAPLLLVLLVGCSSSAPTFVDNLWPFEKKQLASVDTPAERIDELQTLAARARTASSAEQEQTTADLARQLRIESDPLIREEMIRAIAQYQTPLAAAVVAAGLGDPDPNVRIACCKAIARRGDADAVAKLGGVVGGDTDIDVRLAAAKALGEFKGPEAVTALAVGLEDRDPALQYQTVQSLRQASGKDFGQDARAWREFTRGGTPAPPQPISVAERVRGLWPF